MNLKYITTLHYHDGPVIFTATNEFGYNFIFVLLDDEVENYTFIGCKTSTEDIKSFCTSKLDLRTIFLSSDLYYVVKPDNLWNLLIIDTLTSVTEEYLPAEGLYI
jgi:hypothetical protein